MHPAPKRACLSGKIGTLPAGLVHTAFAYAGACSRPTPAQVQRFLAAQRLLEACSLSRGLR